MILSFREGDVVSNAEIVSSFGVGNMGGMRRSKANNCLVIISDHTKGFYEDKWYGDELHYTGMGKIGDQTLEGNQNKTLFESAQTGIELYLFEVIKPTQYTYRGIVQLCDQPYQEIQLDINGDNRKVWIFPLRIISGEPTIDIEDFRTINEIQLTQAEKMSLDKLKVIAESHSTEKPSSRIIQSVESVRDQYIADFVKRKANGKCQLCGLDAPFIDKDGKPYLEAHHIIWLSCNGSDSIDNVVALCPNCHRKMHIINDYEDVKYLQETASRQA